MRYLLLLLLCLFAAAPARATTPYDCVKLAAADATAYLASGGDPEYVRYATLGHLPADERAAYKPTVDFAVNSLATRYQLLVPTVALQDTLVLRVDLKRLGINPKLWDVVVEKGSGPVPIPEPYYSVLLQKDVFREQEYGQWTYDGYGMRRWRTTETRREKVGTKLVVNPGKWVTAPDGGKAYLRLKKLTGSKTPIIRGDWLLTYFLWAPGYYTLLGVDPKGKIAQLDKLAGIDEALAKRTRIQSVADTRRVTLHVRLLERFATPNLAAGGWSWRSFDTDKGIDDEDYVKSFANHFLARRNGARFKSKLKYKATEAVWSWANGLQGGALTDANDNLLNAAVSTIANDGRGVYGSDTNVYCWRNCVGCHDSKGGLQPIDDKVRRLQTGALVTAVVKQLEKDGTEHEEAAKIGAEIQAAYGVDVNALVQRDISVYSVAVAAITGGRTPQKNAGIYEAQVVAYLADVTPETAAAEAGCTVAELKAALNGAAGLDHTLEGFLRNPPVPAARLAWERVGFAQMLTLLSDRGHK